MSLKDHPNPATPRRRKRVAIVVANPAVSNTAGWPVGFWWSELTHPCYALTERGYEVEVFSPERGRCEADAIATRATLGLFCLRSGSAWVSSRHHPLPPWSRTRSRWTGSATDRFDAIIVAGGESPMFSFERTTALHAKFADFRKTCLRAVPRRRRPAPSAVAECELPAKGKTVTGFANVEEDFADNAVWSMNLLSRDRHVMPWRIEDEMRRIGANYVQAGLWRGFAVRDGNLDHRQQNFSGAETAEALIRALGE